MKRVTAYMDDQGKIHATKLLCEQSNAFNNAIDLVEDRMHAEMRADDIVNMIQGDRKSRDTFRKLIDSAEKMDEAMRDPDSNQSFEEVKETAPAETQTEEAAA